MWGSEKEKIDWVVDHARSRLAVAEPGTWAASQWLLYGLVGHSRDLSGELLVLSPLGGGVWGRRKVKSKKRTPASGRGQCNLGLGNQ